MPNRRILPALLAGLLLTVAACGNTASTQGAGKTTLAMITTEPTSLDPNIAQDLSIYIIRQMFEPAFDIDANGKLRALGAKSLDVSQDAKTFTLHLRPDYTWSDGTPVTAQDYVFSFLRILNPATASPNAFFLSPVVGADAYNSGKGPVTGVGIKATDDTTVVIQTSSPSLQMRDILALPFFAPVPEHVVTKFGADWVSPANIVTNGPYTLKQRTVNTSIQLTANPHYAGNKPHITTVNYTITGQDPCTAQLEAYQAHEIDFATCVPGTSIKQLKSGALAQQLDINVLSSTQWAQFDNSHGPWTDVRVRQAFSLAVDRQQLVQALDDGTARPTTHLVPPDVFDPGTTSPPVTGDVTKAKQLLADAGYPGGQGFPPFTLTTSVASGIPLQPLAELLLQRWEQTLGVKGTINVMEDTAFRSWRAARKPGSAPYDIAISQWLSDYPDPVNWYEELIASNAREFQWTDATFTSAVKDALAAPDAGSRTAEFKIADNEVQTQLPAVPLFNRTDVWLVAPSLHGIGHSPTDGMFVIGDASFSG